MDDLTPLPIDPADRAHAVVFIPRAWTLWRIGRTWYRRTASGRLQYTATPGEASSWVNYNQTGYDTTGVLFGRAHPEAVTA